jgi:uncharacterized membrane protein YidH (DUF202 family)
VRISIDSGVVFVDETRGKRCASGWCRTVPVEGLPAQDFNDFAWAILEVKLGEAPPPWVDNLIQSGLLHEMRKFSKFGHGVATLHGGALRELPYWYPHLTSAGELCGNADSTPSITSEPVAQEVSLLSAEKIRKSLSMSEPETQSTSYPGKPVVLLGRDNSNLVSIGGHAVSWGPPATRRRLFRRWCGWRRKQTDAGVTEARGMPKRPAKIEPKTYFANERTFIQWISPVTALIAVAIGLESMGGVFGNSATMWTGLALNAVALIWMFYALVTFLHRIRKIRRHDAHGWDTWFGPTCLVILLALLCTAAALTIVTDGAVLRGWAHKHDSKTAPELAISYAERRLERGCVATPLSIDGLQPDSWELQDELPLADFATEVQRHAYVRKLEAQMQRFVDVDRFKVLERTEHSFSWNQSLATFSSYRTLRHRTYPGKLRKTQAVLKLKGVDSTFHLPTPGPGRNSTAKLEVDSHCSLARMSYSLAVDAPPDVSAWTSSKAVDGLLQTPFNDDGPSLEFTPKVRYQTTYAYRLSSKDMNDADADLLVQFNYLSELDRAMGRNAQKAELSLKLAGAVSLSGLMQAQGLIEFLTESSRNSEHRHSHSYLRG